VDSNLSGMPWVAIALMVIAALAIACSVALARKLFVLRQGRGEMQRVLDLFSEAAQDYALWVLGPEGRIVQWSSGAERVHGYSAAEMIGRHCAVLYTEQDRSAHLPQRLLEQAARQGRHTVTGTRLRKQGSPLAVRTVLHALRDEAGQLTGFCEIECDVSDRIELERTLQQTQATLQQAHKLEALGRLSRGVAHDFNNIVQVIKNCVRVLQRRLADQPPLLQFIDMIERNADRAATLSQHLLGFAHLEADESAVTNVDDVVTETAELLRHTLSESIALEHKLGTTLPWTSIDRAQLEAALLNLAADARDAMPAGGKLTIETANAVPQELAAESASDVDQHVTITVAHSGAQPGRARAASGATRIAALGAGFALTHIHQIVEQVGGRVDIERRADGGTSVTLWLPCTRAPTVHPAHGASRATTAASAH
jgi:PAS domain S-box-containing protein